MLTAKDVMTSPVVAVGPGSTVGEVADLLVSHGISAAPVIEGETLLGIVSEGDLVRRAEIGTAFRHRSWWLRVFTANSTLASEYIKSHSTHVADVMTSNVFSVVEDTPLAEIADLLESRRIKRVPVLREGRVVGVVSRANLVRALATARHVTIVPLSRDDSGIRQDVLHALRQEVWASATMSDVTVADGVVTFWGAYHSEQEKKASHILAETIVGVRGIDDRRLLVDLAYGVI